MRKKVKVSARIFKSDYDYIKKYYKDVSQYIRLATFWKIIGEKPKNRKEKDISELDREELETLLKILRSKK